ncbi:uncharacterized protein METZ01_LOCUS182853, partial [marine metagenome]
MGIRAVLILKKIGFIKPSNLHNLCNVYQLVFAILN